MRAGAILDEAWRNVTTRTTKAVTLAAALALAATAAVLLDTTTIVSIQEQAERWSSSGAAIRVLSAEGAVDGPSCSGLTDVRGATRPSVLAAGALSGGPPRTLDAAPSSSLASFSVTPGLAAVVGIAPAVTEGVWISDQLAATLGAHVGATLATDGGTLTVAGVFPWPDDGRDQRIAFALLVPSATQRLFDECWATISPSTPAAVDLLRTAGLVLPGSNGAAPVSSLNNTLGQSFDAEARYDERGTRHVGLIVAAVGLALALVAARLRRLELASALHAGVSRRALALGAAFETAAWAVPAVLMASAVVAVLVARSTGAANAVDLLAVQAPALASALATSQLGTLAAITMTREDHLFAYFKDR